MKKQPHHQQNILHTYTVIEHRTKIKEKKHLQQKYSKRVSSNFYNIILDCILAKSLVECCIFTCICSFYYVSDVNSKWLKTH